MRVMGATDTGTAGRPKALLAAARAIEKSSDANSLGAKQQDTSEKQHKSIPRLQVELVSQSETNAFDPIWDAPRLRPAFVAQLLGQVMPERRVSVTVETAYGAAAPRKALLVDRKS